MASDALLVAAAAGAVIGGAYLGLTYMAGSLLQSQSIKTYARIEIDEFVLSVALVLLVLGIMSQQGEILKALTGSPISQAGPDVGAYGVVQNALGNVTESLYNETKLLSEANLYLSMVVGYNYNYQLPLFLPAAATKSSTPSAGAAPLMTSVAYGTDSMWNLSLLVRSEYLLYVFFSRFLAPAYLLPAGVLLRFFPPARKVGGLLIGAALALMFAFPTAIAWGDSLRPLLMPAQLIQPLSPPGSPPSDSIVCDEFVGSVKFAGEVVPPIVLCSILALFGGPGIPSSPAPIGPGYGCAYVLSLIDWTIGFSFSTGMAITLPNGAIVLSPEKLVSDYYKPIAEIIMPHVVRTGMAAMTLVVLHIAALVLVAKSLAEFFGNEGQIYGLSKLV